MIFDQITAWMFHELIPIPEEQMFSAKFSNTNGNFPLYLDLVSETIKQLLLFT